VDVEGSWGWAARRGRRLPGRLPAQGVLAGRTKVTVTADLYGVSYGEGRYGAADVTSSFTIGREQIVKADARSHRMLVFRDGQQVADYPASYGWTPTSTATPARACTWSARSSPTSG
jgi:hypothetical protein